MMTSYRPTFMPHPLGLTFHNMHRWQFSEPEAVPAFSAIGSLLKQPGVYAILTDDPTWTPRPFRVLYFGEAENIWARATTMHENYSAWQRGACIFGNLYRSFHAMPGSTQIQRQMVESALITGYSPPANEKLSFDFAPLLSRK